MMRLLGLLCLALAQCAPVYALGDETVFADTLGAVLVTYVGSVQSAQAKRVSDDAACEQLRSAVQRGRCYTRSTQAYTAALNVAGSIHIGGLVNASCAYYGVTCSPAAVQAEFDRLRALEFEAAFAAQQARIDACLALDPTSTVCE